MGGFNVLRAKLSASGAYRVSPEKQLIIDAEINKMLELKAIRRSKCASPVVSAQKKQGDWRFCVDFRKLNQNTKPDAQPIPIIEDLLAEIKDSKFFITNTSTTSTPSVRQDRVPLGSRQTEFEPRIFSCRKRYKNVYVQWYDPSYSIRTKSAQLS